MNKDQTPAPWSLFKGGNTLAVCIEKTANGKTPCVVNWPGFDSNGLPRKTNIANARLIAAAPDLLEALQTLLAVSECADETGYVEDHGFVDIETVQQRARDAITKALGHSGQNKVLVLSRKISIWDNPSRLRDSGSQVTGCERVVGFVQVAWLFGCYGCPGRRCI